MTKTREIKRRITSINSTKKITKAMQMVSASRMKRAQNRVNNAVPYAEGLFKIVNEIGPIHDYTHPLLRQVDEIKNVAVLIIGPHRGFVGGMITTLFLAADQLIDKIRLNNQGVHIFGISMHRKGLDIVNKLGIESKYHFADYFENPTTTQLTPIIKVISDGFINKEFDEVYIVYMHFINTIVQKPEFQKILPISLSKFQKDAESIKKLSNDKKQAILNLTYNFEPNVKEVLNRLVPEYFETQIYAALLDSMASEYSARMVAMKNATDNANEMYKELELIYNRTRQASITQEILEVISGRGKN